MRGKKRKDRNQGDPIKIIALITVAIQLISTIIDLIEKLIE